MKPTRDLRRLQRAGQHRISLLRARAASATAPNRLGADADVDVAHCIIELSNLWHGMSRSLYISTALRARDGAGARITVVVPTVATAQAAIGHAIRRTKPQLFQKVTNPNHNWRWNEEPTWAKTSTLLACMDEIGASNRTVVSNAVSIQSSVFDDLPKCRNFYAHRNADTVRRLFPVFAKYGINPRLTTSQALSTPASTPLGQRPQPLLLDWIDDVRDTVDLIV